MVMEPCNWCLHVDPSAYKSVHELVRALTTEGSEAASEMMGAETAPEYSSSYVSYVSKWLRLDPEKGVVKMSTGFTAVIAAMVLCHSVSVYGFGLETRGSVPHLPTGSLQCENGLAYTRYYPTTAFGNMSCRREFDHPFEVEHEALKTMHHLGLLTIPDLASE